VNVGDGSGEVGAHHDAVQIAEHQQGRILQHIAVAQELVKGGIEILVLALILPTEEAALPDIGETVAPAMLGGTLLEAERLAGGVGRGGRGMVEDAAEVEKVLLRGGALLQLHLAPLGNELVDSHGQHNTTRTRRETRRMWMVMAIRLATGCAEKF